ncbi:MULTISPECIES: hypothetical protein, partial [Sulfitobacter]|uniref:hypothetical protein n=1 Tax=Sulfitobacter TaxID=60136 RepID=UPI00257F72AF
SASRDRSSTQFIALDEELMTRGFGIGITSTQRRLYTLGSVLRITAARDDRLIADLSPAKGDVAAGETEHSMLGIWICYTFHHHLPHPTAGELRFQKLLHEIGSNRLMA